MKTSLILLVFTIASYSLSGAQDQSCSAVMSTWADSIRFLEGQKDTRQSPCISSVIRQLGRVVTSMPYTYWRAIWTLSIRQPPSPGRVC